ncbi:MAG TPA: 4-aminobutyrate--2-oxoglutarate transaminase [Pseudonocardia sp.]|jgi:4-aminobutyrate aminotransferase/(S)-3-amino-2-methylpropionate transaminase
MTAVEVRGGAARGGTGLPQERRLVTEIPGPVSKEWSARREAAVSSAVSTVMPVFAVAAGGGVIVDADGNSLIDFGSGIAVTTVGNAAPQVTAAVVDQVERFTHTCFMVTPYAGYVEVAEALNALTPGDHEKRSALFNSGAEAVENAVKIARLATGRTAVAAFDHGYHGRTNLTMALTAKAMPYKLGFGPFAPDVYRAPMSYPLHDGLSGPEAARRAIGVLDKQVGASQLAAVVIEPIQGEGGFVVPAPGFLPALADWCRENGIVFIADEVQSGFARTGAMFACEHEGVVPDLITTAKGIAGGLPLAGVTGRAEIMNAPHGGGVGGTFGGNPIACAAALGAIRAITDDGLVARAREIESVVVPRLRALAERDPRIADVRGRGAMLAVELAEPGSGEPATAATKAIAAAAHARGLILLTCGTYGNVIRLLPPLSMPEHLLAEGLDVLEEAFAATR